MEYITQKRKLGEDSYIKVNNFRNIICPSGFSMSDMKSIFQKSVRRNDSKNCLLAIKEMIEISKQNKSCFTNLINRIVICSLEDIDIANPFLINKILHLCLNIKEYDRLKFYCYFLCISKKTRISDQAYYVYGNLYINNKFREEILNENIEIIDDFDYIKPCIYIEDEFDYIIGCIENCLRNKDYNVLKLIYQLAPYSKKQKFISSKKFLNLYKDSKYYPKPHKKKRADFYIWKLLKVLLIEDNIINEEKDLDIYIYWYYKLPESRVVLNYIISLYINSIPFKNKQFDLIVTDEIKNYIEDLFNNEHLIIIPEKYLDCHTLYGKQKGMGHKEFAEYGSVIIPEEETLTNYSLKKLFNLN